jgi:hypothetical protein
MEWYDIMVVKKKLGLAFVQLTFRSNVVRVLAFLVVVALCRSSRTNKTTVQHIKTNTKANKELYGGIK